MAAAWQVLQWPSEQAWKNAGSPNQNYSQWVKTSGAFKAGASAAAPPVDQSTIDQFPQPAQPAPKPQLGGGLTKIAGDAAGAVVKGVSTLASTPFGVQPGRPNTAGSVGGVVTGTAEGVMNANLADPVYKAATGEELPDTPLARIAEYGTDPFALTGIAGAAKVGGRVLAASIATELGGAIGATLAPEAAKELGAPGGVQLAASLVGGAAGGFGGGVGAGLTANLLEDASKGKGYVIRIAVKEGATEPYTDESLMASRGAETIVDPSKARILGPDEMPAADERLVFHGTWEETLPEIRPGLSTTPREFDAQSFARSAAKLHALEAGVSEVPVAGEASKNYFGDLIEQTKAREQATKKFTRQAARLQDEINELKRAGAPDEFIQIELEKVVKELGLDTLAKEAGIDLMQYFRQIELQSQAKSLGISPAGTVDELELRIKNHNRNMDHGLESSPTHSIDEAVGPVLENPKNAKSRKQRNEQVGQTYSSGDYSPEARARAIANGLEIRSPDEVPNLPNERQLTYGTPEAAGVLEPGAAQGLGRPRTEFPPDTGADQVPIAGEVSPSAIGIGETGQRGLFEGGFPEYGPVPPAGNPLDTLHLQMPEVPDGVLSIIDDIVKFEMDDLAELAKRSNNPLAQTARRVSSAVTGAKPNAQLDTVIRMQDRIETALATAQITEMLRSGRMAEFDPMQLYTRIQQISKSAVDYIVKNSFSKVDAEVLQRELAALRKSPDYGSLASALPRLLDIQNALKNINLSYDLSVVGQQLEAALRRGSLPLVIDTIDRLMVNGASSVVNGSFFDTMRLTKPNLLARMVVGGLEISGNKLKAEAAQFEKLLKNNTPQGRARQAADKFMQAGEEISNANFGFIAGARIRAAQGLLVQANLLHGLFSKVPGLKSLAAGLDTSSPAVFKKIMDQANMIGSASRGATSTGRRQLEQGLLLTPSMTRAQLAELGSIFDVNTPIGILNSINLLASYGIYFGGVLAARQAMSSLGYEPLNDFTLDPTSYDFGKAVMEDGRTFDYIPQASFYKMIRSGLNNATPEGLAEAAAKFTYGRANMLPQTLPTIGGIGYAKEGGVGAQVFPTGQAELEWGWFGDNEWDDPLTWQQRAGNLVPFPLTAGNIAGEWAAADLSSLGGFGEALADTVIAGLGQTEYEENSFGAVERISDSEFGTNFNKLSSQEQISVIKQAEAEGRNVGDYLIRPWNTAAYQDTWAAIKAKAGNSSVLGAAMEYESLNDYMGYWEKQADDSGFSPEEKQTFLANRLKEFNNAVKKATGRDYDEISREQKKLVITAHPEIYDAVVAQYIEKGWTIPKWLIEHYKKVTGESR